MQLNAPIKIFSGTATNYLSKNICKSMGRELGNVTKLTFSDGEFAVTFNETIRGSHVFLVQSTFPNADNLMELLMLVDAAKRASAYKIVAVMPYFGFARQDRKDQPRVSIGAKLIADLLTAAGIDRLITMDLHADQIQGFFNLPVDHLYASSVFMPFIKNMQLENLVIASPDVGGSKRANTYAKYMEVPMVICHKTRAKANVISDMRIIGDVKGKNVIIVDDMIDTAGTLTKAADIMMNEGALSVRSFASHPVFSGNAYENIENSLIKEVYVTDSIPLRSQSDKIKVLSVADLIGDTIEKVYHCKSISSQFLI